MRLRAKARHNTVPYQHETRSSQSSFDYVRNRRTASPLASELLGNQGMLLAQILLKGEGTVGLDEFLGLPQHGL